VRIIRPDTRGPDVHDVQQRLSALDHRIDGEELDAGHYGSSTRQAVADFQRSRSIGVDGIVGPETWAHLVEAGYRFGDRTLYLRYPYFRGDDVRELQRKLNALGFDAWREDGILGEHVDRAVREFQRNTGVDPDGIVGPETFESLARLRPNVAAPSRAMVREAESLRQAHPMDGSVIAIDAGHGADDRGAEGPSGTAEASVTFAVAERLAEELEKRGARPRMLRTRDETLPASDRARAANALGALACISIHMNDGGPDAEGTTCVYFGTDRTHSPAGMRLAGLIQGELVSRMGLRDCGTHPMAITLLRETRMPCVVVEPCFITNPREETLLGEPGFQRDLGVALAIAVERFVSAQGETGGVD